MSLTDNIKQREVIAGYVKEAVSNLKSQDVLKVRMSEIRNSVKESELIDPKEFGLIVKAAYNLDRLQEDVDSKSAAIESLEVLGL